jgi:arginyl-tRNA synthetase
MSITTALQKATLESLQTLYQKPFSEKDFQVNITSPDFTGDYTVVLFSLLKTTGKNPLILGNELGDVLLKNYPHLFTSFNVVKGFLNLEISFSYWINFLEKNYNDICFGKQALNRKRVMVEYSSPNTNKPLHLGHLRNNFLGWSVAEILRASGYDVLKSCIINDRGIHICKSMIAWQKYANGESPSTLGIKGDHFVGEYYVRFNDELKKQVKELKDAGVNDADAEKMHFI